MNKDGRIFVEVSKETNRFDVEISGHVTYVNEFEVDL